MLVFCQHEMNPLLTTSSNFRFNTLPWFVRHISLSLTGFPVVKVGLFSNKVDTSINKYKEMQHRWPPTQTQHRRICGSLGKTVWTSIRVVPNICRLRQFHRIAQSASRPQPRKSVVDSLSSRVLCPGIRSKRLRPFIRSNCSPCLPKN